MRCCGDGWGMELLLAMGCMGGCPKMMPQRGGKGKALLRAEVRHSALRRRRRSRTRAAARKRMGARMKTRTRAAKRAWWTRTRTRRRRVKSRGVRAGVCWH